MGLSNLSLSGPTAINGIRVKAPITGKEVYVHSGTGGTSSRNGLDPGFPFSTLALALDNVDPSEDDTIYLMPGHVESMGDAQIAIDVVGVNVIGLGHGGSRPRFDYDHANSSIDITANDCVLSNVTIRPSITDVLVGIDVNAAVLNTLIHGVEALPGEDGAGVDDFALVVDIKAGCTTTVVSELKVRQHASGAGYIAGVRLTGASDDVWVVDSDIHIIGAGVVAPINGITTLSTNFRALRNILMTDAEPGIEMLTNSTGILAQNWIFSNLATIDAAIVADIMANFDNLYVEVGPEAGAGIGTLSIDD